MNGQDFEPGLWVAKPQLNACNDAEVLSGRQQPVSAGVLAVVATLDFVPQDLPDFGNWHIKTRVIERMRAPKSTKSGNPIGAAETERAIQRLLRGGTGINKTAATVGVGTATVQPIRAERRAFESAAAEMARALRGPAPKIGRPGVQISGVKSLRGV